MSKKTSFLVADSPGSKLDKAESLGCLCLMPSFAYGGCSTKVRESFRRVGLNPPKMARFRRIDKAGEKMTNMAANSATTTRATKASTSSRRPAKTPRRALRSPETLEHLLATYRNAPDQVGEHGHAPLHEYDGKFVEAGQRIMVFPVSTPNAGQSARQAVFVHRARRICPQLTDFDVLVVTCCWWHCTGPPGF